MAYQKQNFANGNVLTAENLNHMENGIADVESTANAAKTVVDKIIDPTLSLSGKAADAKATGDAVGQIKEGIIFGKNVLKLFKDGTTIEKNGITITVEDGCLVLDGTFSGEMNTIVRLSPVYEMLKPDKNYTYSLTKISGQQNSVDGSGNMLIYTSDTLDLSDSVGQASGIPLYRDNNVTNTTITQYSGKKYQYLCINLMPYDGIPVSFSNCKIGVQVEEGTNFTGFEKYTESLAYSDTIVYTDISISSVDELISEIEKIKDSGCKNRYRLHLKNGTYDLSNYSHLMDAKNYGLVIPPFVELIGESSEKTIITAKKKEKDQYFSTLNFSTSGGIKNLTVIGTNTRYAIHDDFAHISTYAKTYERNIENCLVIANDCYYSMALGGGCRSGFVGNIKNSKFISNLGYAFSYHSNTDFDIPANITIRNCIFASKLSNWGIRFGGMKSGVLNRVNVTNSVFNGIRLYEEQEGSGIDWLVSGGGNSQSPYSVTTSEDLITFSDETLVLPASEYISKGVAVKYADNGYSAKVTSDNLLFLGVSAAAVEEGGYVTIKNCGCVNVSDMNNLSCNVGDKIIVSERGTFSVGNDANDYIGICIAEGIVKLKK